MKKSVEHFYKELSRAYEENLLVGYSIDEDPPVTEKSISVHIIFDPLIGNCAIDKLIQYIEATYNIGVTNRCFVSKELWLRYYHDDSNNAPVHPIA